MAWRSSSARMWTLPRDGGVHGGAADLLHRDALARHRLDHLRAGDEHLRVPRHDDEVHQRRRIGGAAGARAGDDRDLRHDAGQQHVAIEHLAVAGERVDALLDAGTAGVLEADQRRAVAGGVVLRPYDLARVHLAERAAHHQEVLAERRHLAAVDVAGADDDAVLRDVAVGHAEGGAAVADVRAVFLERLFLQQAGQTLARGEQAFCMPFRHFLGRCRGRDRLAPSASVARNFSSTGMLNPCRQCPARNLPDLPRLRFDLPHLAHCESCISDHANVLGRYLDPVPSTRNRISSR